MDFREPTNLGRTGLRVGRLGLASSYGAPAAAFEEAFEKGCNYFYWGSLRREGMAEAIRNLCGQGQRDRLVVVLQSYARLPGVLEWSCRQGLRRLGLSSADGLVLGWHRQRPNARLLERAWSLKEQGMVRFLGLSSHNRKIFPELAQEGIFDVFHIRYNAAHRGAESEAFAALLAIPEEARPGIVTYTATCWGRLLRGRYLPPGEEPLQAEDCYRFALSHAAVDVCVTGPSNLSHIRGALKTLELGPLTAKEYARAVQVGDWVHG